MGHHVPEGYKYGNLAFQVGRVSRIRTIKYGLESRRTHTRAGLRWRGPAAILQVNYRPIFSSERVPHIKKPAIVREIKEIWSWNPDGIPVPRQTGRLTVGRKLTSTSTSLTLKLHCSYSHETARYGPDSQGTWK
jgi:hypothetical protein